MALLFDKYRPKNLDEIKYHKDISNILKSFDINNIPHILMYGPNGSGKKTLLYSFLGYDKKTRVTRTIKTSSKDIPFTIYRNSKFIELDIKEMGMYCKFIIRDFLKNLAETKQVSNNLPKIIILHHFELLSIESQFILNKILESYSTNCKFILISNTINNIIVSLRSNCICMRINSPSEEDIRTELLKIIDENKIDISTNQLAQLMNTNYRNLKTSILQLEIFSLLKSQKISINEKKIQDILKLILKKRITLTTVSKITSYLYEFIMDNNISSNKILLDIYYLIIEYLDKNNIEKYIEITEITSKYDIRLIQGSKDIMHIQAYIFNIISILNNI